MSRKHPSSLWPVLSRVRQDLMQDDGPHRAEGDGRAEDILHEIRKRLDEIRGSERGEQGHQDRQADDQHVALGQRRAAHHAKTVHGDHHAKHAENAADDGSRYRGDDRGKLADQPEDHQEDAGGGEGDAAGDAGDGDDAGIRRIAGHRRAAQKRADQAAEPFAGGAPVQLLVRQRLVDDGADREPGARRFGQHDDIDDQHGQRRRQRERHVEVQESDARQREPGGVGYRRHAELAHEGRRDASGRQRDDDGEQAQPRAPYAHRHARQHAADEERGGNERQYDVAADAAAAMDGKDAFLERDRHQRDANDDDNGAADDRRYEAVDKLVENPG